MIVLTAVTANSVHWTVCVDFSLLRGMWMSKMKMYRCIIQGGKSEGKA